MVERYVRDVEVAGSNPVTPIFLLGYRKALSYGLCGFLLDKKKFRDMHNGLDEFFLESCFKYKMRV